LLKSKRAIGIVYSKLVKNNYKKWIY